WSATRSTSRSSSLACPARCSTSRSRSTQGCSSRFSAACSSMPRSGSAAATASAWRPKRSDTTRRRTPGSRACNPATEDRRRGGGGGGRRGSHADILASANTSRPPAFRLREEEDQHEPEKDAVHREPVHLPRRDEADEDRDREIADDRRDERAHDVLREVRRG